MADEEGRTKLVDSCEAESESRGAEKGSGEEGEEK